eukprot:3181117-Amphidinium_carterae.1
MPRTTNSADFYTKACEKAGQEAHMARMGLVVLDETTPQGLKVEVDLKAMSTKTFLPVRGAEVTEEHSVDKGASDFAWLFTSVVLVCAFFVTRVQDFGRHGDLGSRSGGCPQCVQTTETGTQTVGYEFVYVSAYGECFHVEAECMSFRQARTTTRKRRCQLCVGIEAEATPRSGDERNNMYCLLGVLVVIITICAAIGLTVHLRFVCISTCCVEKDVLSIACIVCGKRTLNTRSGPPRWCCSLRCRTRQTSREQS